MDILKIKDSQGNWKAVPALVGPQGEQGIQGEKGDRGDTVIIAKDYADLTFPVYAGKTYCYHDNKPYVAKTDIATTEAWTAAHWDEVSFEDEIGGLKSALNDGLNGYLVFDTVDGQYVNSDGTIKSHGAYIRSDYINCAGWSALIIKGIPTSTRFGAFYDSNKDFVQFVDLQAGELTKITIPSNATYCMISGQKDLGWFDSVKVVNLGSIDTTLTQSGKAADAEAVGQKFNAFEDIVDSLQNGWLAFETVDGQYVNSDGSFLNNGNYIRSDYISCAGWTSLIILGIPTTTRFGAFYNSNKEFVAFIELTAGAQTEIQIPAGATYFAISGQKALGWFDSVKVVNLGMLGIKLVDEKIDALGDTFAEITDEVQSGYLVFKTFDGEYIRSDGTTDKNTDYIRSDYISCAGLETIVIEGIPTNSTNGAFYDANKSFVKYIETKAGARTEYQVPANASYYRISGQKADGWFDSVKILAPLYLTSERSELNKEYLFSLIEQLSPGWISGHYADYETGQIIESGSWDVIEFAPSSGYITTNANAASPGGIVFIDNNGAILERYTNTGSLVKTYAVPSGTVKIRICNNRVISAGVEVFAVGGKAKFGREELQEMSDVIDELGAASKKMAVIGDSISSNNATGKVPVNYLAWPTMLANRFKNKVEYQNLTYPGKRWHDGLIQDCAAVDSDSDLVVCALGINDIARGYTLGDVATIMALPLEDVTTDTLMGIYRKGLETLKNRMKNESIIVCVAPVTSQGVDSWENSEYQDRRDWYTELINLRNAIKAFVVAEGGPANGWIFVNGREIFDVSEDALNLYYGKRSDGTPDGTHPNICGQAMIAAKIYDSIPPIGAIKASNYITE